MIPRVVPPLTGLSIVVTRPAVQAESLCAQIARHGGTPLLFPALEIEPLECATPPVGEYGLVVFLSSNAVAHGARYVQKTAGTRVAAIGKATAAALAQAQLPADIVPPAGFTSEALLDHPGLEIASGTRVLIVHGVGGRELLKETLLARGMTVETCEVYRRVRPALDEKRRAEIEAHWLEEGIDVVTLTSVETLTNLLALLSERGRSLLAATSLLVPSQRIMAAAGEAGLRGGMILAPGADDASLIGALAAWRMRARTR